MTTARSHAVRAPARGNLSTRLRRAASTPAARTAFVAIGVVGLAGLALAIFGPKRFQREVLQPLAKSAASESEKLWAETQSLRQQVRALIGRAADSKGREAMVRDLQSWIGHFRAS